MEHRRHLGGNNTEVAARFALVILLVHVVVLHSPSEITEQCCVRVFYR